MTMLQYRGRPERFLSGHADDERLRQAVAGGTPAAIAATVARIRDEETTALDQLRALLRP
jgi:hypothetical protein